MSSKHSYRREASLAEFFPDAGDRPAVYDGARRLVEPSRMSPRPADAFGSVVDWIMDDHAELLRRLE
ncbi:hypothetical protein [Nocardia neocaledoniensis]|uniref:hypothetical protein n=1 Tax=Nocardia neocaledoniensis TaxID=236511 RepID=UPI0024562A25|nr:hypothetical protein [Nocardia neocaledoniensis]